MQTATNPDSVLAYVRVAVLTDRLLEIADELREAQGELHKALPSAPTVDATPPGRPTLGGAA